MAWVALAGAILATASTVQQGRNQKAYADYQSAQATADAQAEKGAARVHAENIRSMASSQRKQARAGMAGSGIDVTGAGTPLLIDQKITADGEHDAFLTLLGGENAVARGNATAQGYAIQGKQAQQASYASAASSLLQMGSSMYQAGGGWKGGSSRSSLQQASNMYGWNS